MANTTTVQDMIDAISGHVARKIAASNTFITQADCINWLNQGLKRIHYALADAKDGDYFDKQDTITLVAGQDTYALSPDFYRASGVSMLRNGRTSTLHRYMPKERNRFDGESAVWAREHMYRVQGSNIHLIPTPSEGTLTVNYIPHFTRLTDVDATVDDSVPSGFEDFAVYHASAMARRKEKDDPAEFDLMARFEWEMIVDQLQSRDQQSAARVTDHYGRFQRRRYDWGQE